MRKSRRRPMTLVMGLLAAGLAGCSMDGLLKSDVLPPTVTDPAITETPEGALAAYHGTIALFRDAFGVGPRSAVAIAGVLGDELTLTGTLFSAEATRSLPEGNYSYDANTTYSALQKVRGQAAQTLGLLRQYQPAAPALAGHVYALKAYAELLLADLFCSGIPLSTLEYGGGYTYRPGSSTMEVLTQAAALFDTALVLAADSTAILNLARVGQARSRLALGDYAAAAAVAAAVPDAYRYALTFNAGGDTLAAPNSFATVGNNPWSTGHLTVSDREGINGLAWRSSGDPRTPTTNVGTVSSPSWHPNAYATDGSSPIVLASGVEARLITAEAQWHANPADGAWLATLNALRTDGTFEIVDSQAVTDTTIDNGVIPPDTTVDTTGWTYDTLWHAGSGGVAGLRPLADPGTAAGQVDLLFQERGFWLFLTGHRQGDLRRLIRQYGRTEDQVYPTGLYGAIGNYGTDVTIPIPSSEQISNPQFTGCASREA